MEEEFECPILHRVIDMGYCYDINMVANEMVKEEILKDKIDREKALEMCRNCKHKQY